MVRFLLLIIWAGSIFLFTCSESMEQIFREGIISFHWNLQPSLAEFWSPLPELNDEFILRKIGHAISFFILTILLYSCFLSKTKMIALGFFYAISTEVLQLFFQRDGRLFDIGFDGIGVLAATIIVSSVSFLYEKSLTRNSQT